ncbi:beta-lactamase/transpeptidase-like protein [Tothia fuscella]|uniref:Beta-lactamase/transpeptidase-like protein n=1 Tax=Tothia fuscella TaxID=1048955 RepID=A0A9P4U077_9PEZI|nr:beta-lactamase/transpeptidase-like protein [Tothia fuscella]
MRSFEVFTASVFAASVFGQEANLQGFSKAGMDNLNAAMKKNAGSGLVSLLAKNGEIVHFEAYGEVKGKPMPKDSIWNIMSMTKPISGAAMMTFYEEGKFQLDDPVAKHIPEVGQMKVSGQPQATPMTMAQLMSHSAGFPGLIAASGATLTKGVESVVKGNLAAQPGTKWAYGPGVEIQGYLMEKWAGKDFNDILQERILGPLGMNDTGFFIAGEKRSRIIGGAAPASKPTRIIPSYGLHSTAMDYFKFTQMLINDGEYNGKRYMKPESVKLMRTNVLQKGVPVTLGGGKGVGFGLNVAVLVDPVPPETRPKECFYWAGAFGTIFWIDPVNKLTWIGMLSGSMATGSNIRAAAAKVVYADLNRAAKRA